MRVVWGQVPNKCRPIQTTRPSSSSYSSSNTNSETQTITRETHDTRGVALGNIFTRRLVFQQ